MNFKKFISGISALAIAASAFAGMAVTASAYNTTASSIDGGSAKITQDFESESDGWTRDSSGDSFVGVETANSNANTTTIYGVPYNSSKSGCAHLTISPAKTADSTNVSFDFKIDAGNKSNANTLQLISGVGSKNGWVTGTTFLDIRITASGNGYANNGFTVNSNAVTTNAIVTNERASQSGLGERDSTGWLHLDAVLDFTNDAMNITITRKSDGSAVYSNTALAFTNSVDSFDGIALTATKTYGGTYIDNIEIKDNPVASSIVITGDDTVTAGNSAEYTATVLDQYGDKYADADLSAAGYTNASYSDGTITVPSNFENDETITLTASYEGLENVTKTVTASALKGYTINTTPYAAISVDGAAAVSTGADGKYVFDIDDAETHTVTISKTGYVSKENISITPVNNGSQDLTLTAESGVTYYEDFSYVNDNFGLSGSASNGIFSVALGTSAIKTFDSPLTVNQKVITIETIGAKTNREGILNLEGTGAYLRYFTDGSISVYGTSKTSVGLGDMSDGYHKIQIFTTSRTQAASLFVDGVKKSGTLYTSYGADWTGLKTGTYTYTRSTSIDSISVTNVAVNSDGKSPVTYNVTIGDADAVTYLPGTEITLPAAAEGKVWSADGTTEVASTTITVTGDATYTQINDPSAVTAPTATAAWLRDYKDLESGQNGASVWALTVVPGTYTVNKIGLSLNGSDVAWDNHDNLNISGEVIFAAVLNKIQSEVHSLTAYFNDGSLYATAYTD